MFFTIGVLLSLFSASSSKSSGISSAPLRSSGRISLLFRVKKVVRMLYKVRKIISLHSVNTRQSELICIIDDVLLLYPVLIVWRCYETDDNRRNASQPKE